MIDREKVVNVLIKRFPGASAQQIASAANAIVGLTHEYEPVAPSEIGEFACVVSTSRFTAEDVASGGVRLYRRRDESN